MIMVTATEAAKEYKLTLAELVNNNKTQINLLTILAEDYQNFAQEIVNAIENQVYSSGKEQKLPILYVIDSILKNVTNSPYKDLFGKIIMKVFIHIFINGDEKVRLSLYKLRQTWNGIFLPSLLYQLDMKVNKEDSAWPVTSPAGRSASQQQVASATPAHVHVNPRFVQPPATAARDPRSAAKSQTPPKEVKPAVNKVKAEVSGDILDSLLGNSSPKTEGTRLNGTSTVNNVKRKGEEPTPPEVESKKRRSPVGSMDQDHRVRPLLPRNTVKPHQSVRPQQQNCRPVVVSTPVPGSHAFAAPVNVIANGVPLSSAPLPSNPVISAAPPSVMFPAAAIIHAPPFNGNLIPPSSQPPPFRSGPSAFPSFPTPPQARVPPQPVHITNDTVRLDGIPANNRIFVDSKAHEVFYVDNTAVIERNGLPHRIYFSGTPRKVVIDGTGYDLGFGEKKTVYIDGIPHVLRFGAPSRELYMGEFAFKGQFGGPPIIATINGIRHEIRLSGPAPEVKIEPDAAHDLMRFMPSVRDRAPEPKPASTFADLDKIMALIQQRRAETKPEPVKNNRKPAYKEPSPPKPSEHTFDTVERKPAPATSLRNLDDMRALKIRYDVIVDALHSKQNNACPHCGKRMELKGPEYEKHLDWHVQKSLRNDSSSTSRSFYASSSKEWIKGDGEEEAVSSDVKDSHVEAVSVPTVASGETSSKECEVCGEKFVEYFDEVEDTWLLKDCVLVGKRTYHSGCAQDASVADVSVISIKDDMKDMKPFVDHAH